MDMSQLYQKLPRIPSENARMQKISFSLLPEYEDLLNLKSCEPVDELLQLMNQLQKSWESCYIFPPHLMRIIPPEIPQVVILNSAITIILLAQIREPDQ